MLRAVGPVYGRPGDGEKVAGSAEIKTVRERASLRGDSSCQPLFECVEVESLNAAFQREGSGDVEDRIPWLIPFTPFVQESLIEQTLKQCCSKKNSHNVRARLTLLLD